MKDSKHKFICFGRFVHLMLDCRSQVPETVKKTPEIDLQALVQELLT